MSIPVESINHRHKMLGEAIKKAGLEGIALNAGPSLVYFTDLHFHLSERPVVAFFTQNKPPVLVLPELESAKVKNLDYILLPLTYPEDPVKWEDVFRKGAEAAGLDRGNLGVEDRRMRFLELDLIKSAVPKVEILNAVETVAKLRMIKDDSEIAAMQGAVDIAQEAMEATLPLIKVGMTEKEVAAELVMQLFRQGSGTALPFQPIVSAGPNSANPHASPSDQPLAKGDLLVIDWGASVDGYFSDLTRTFGVVEVNAEQEKIHKIVLEANTAARAMAKPGVSCGEVDKAARDVIEKTGYGEYFIHRTGHGLGMEGHEEPYLRADNTMRLEAGMTITIEPGIYVPQKDGVRVEDDVVITEDGLRSFSDMERGLRMVG
jgi:Xaa-Pro dipeptidase